MIEMKISPFLLPHRLSFPDLPFLALISSFPPILFLFSSSSPSLLPSFISPAYLICIHLLTDLLCHKTANYLICPLPLFPPITSLPPTFVLASHILSTVSLFVLYLLVKFFLPVPPARLLHPHLLAPSALWLTVFAWLCDL